LEECISPSNIGLSNSAPSYINGIFTIINNNIKYIVVDLFCKNGFLQSIIALKRMPSMVRAMRSPFQAKHIKNNMFIRISQ
jgi:hypothetical protein